jgi:hypothetical protein
MGAGDDGHRRNSTVLYFRRSVRRTDQPLHHDITCIIPRRHRSGPGSLIRTRCPALDYLLLSAGLPIGLGLVVSIFKPLFVARYFLPSLPFFALLAAVGILQIKPRALAAGVVALITILSLREDRLYYRAGPVQDWRGAINFVAARGRAEDALVIYPEYYWVAPEYYISRLDQRAAFPSFIYEAPGSPASFAAFFAASDAVSRRRIWFTFPSQDPIADRGVEDALRNAMAGRHATDDRQFPGVRLMLLELP